MHAATRRVGVALSVLAALLIAGGGTPAAAQAVAEAPIFKVGDQWRWTGGAQRRVLAIEGSNTITTFWSSGCQNCRAYRDKNLTVIKLVDREGNIVVDDSQIGYKTLDFPLTIGKRWESNVMLVNRTTRVAEPYANQFRVEAQEEVKTKAGTFKAFRISHLQQRAHSTFSSEAGLTWRVTLWYSPDAKAVVKREANTRVNSGPDWELESYSLK